MRNEQYWLYSVSHRVSQRFQNIVKNDKNIGAAYDNPAYGIAIDPPVTFAFSRKSLFADKITRNTRSDFTTSRR